MAGRIITARHGRPDVDRTVKITARQYGQWWSDYDLAGLAAGETPPDSLRDAAASCDVVISSTLPRAIETAAKVVQGARTVPQDALYVEAPLPPPPIPFLKLTPTTWGVISRAFWLFGYAPNGLESHSGAHTRVGMVADRLAEYAANGQTVLLCAHGYLNWMIDRRLKRRGWTRTAHVGGNKYWSWRAYEKKVAEAASSRQSPVGDAQTAE